MPGSTPNQQLMFRLSEINGLILDIDGVLYEGNRILPGAVELIAYLNQQKTPYVFYSNNTTYSFQYHVDKLLRLGVPSPQDVLLTAARVTAQLLASEAKPGALCFVVGEQGLVEALQEVGFTVSQEHYEGSDYVVIGMDRHLSYEKLKSASLAIREGANFISSNPDPSYPDGINIVPASGAIQVALEASTGVKARVTGKPALPGFQLALERLGTNPWETGFVGDQPDIDIQGAINAGIWAFLVLSSLTPQYQPTNGYPQPQAIFKNTMDFLKYWMTRDIEQEIE